MLTILGSVLLVGACSKVTRGSEDQEIVLSPYGTSLTKADTELLGADKVFGVYAYNSACAGGTVWNDASAWADASSYFENAAFSYQGTSWSGTPDPYYWPLSGSLMFAGYCPHQSVSNGAVTAVDLVNTDKANPYLKINFTQNSSATVDLLWFDVKDVAAGKTLSKTSDAIPLTFKHALSKVSFTFADSQNHYKLSSVALKGLVNEGTFNSGSQPSWTPGSEEVDYTLLTEPEPEAELQALNNWTSAVYIIPQILDEDVVLEFIVTDGFGSDKIELPLVGYTSEWELGKSYLYTIIANADPIEFGTPTFEIIIKNESL